MKFAETVAQRLHQASQKLGEPIYVHDTYDPSGARHGKTTSQHLRGLALDLDQNVYKQGTERYEKARAALESSGLKNFPEEYWHFSTTGR